MSEPSIDGLRNEINRLIQERAEISAVIRQKQQQVIALFNAGEPYTDEQLKTPGPYWPTNFYLGTGELIEQAKKAFTTPNP